MQPTVLLVTVVAENATTPTAHGIYTNLPQALQCLHSVGIHPGFNCKPKTLFNRDGTRAGTLFGGNGYVATATMLPRNVAVSIARGDSVWDVPDTVDALVGLA